MDTKEQIEQLKLAAELLETGHPWEYESNMIQGNWYSAEKGISTLHECLMQNCKIRPALIQPPEGLTLWNPINLTGARVGIGYRLPCKDEILPDVYEFTYEGYPWYKSSELSGKSVNAYTLNGIRIPSSIPWPEIPKPWSLPPPPEGKQWMLADKWTQEMLPEWYRPLLEGERCQEGDEGTVFWDRDGDKCKWIKRELFGEVPQFPCRTRRPLPTAKKKVPLMLEDVMPGSVIWEEGWPDKTWEMVTGTEKRGASYGVSRDTHDWSYLMRECKINRSIPLSGKWNPDAWEACEKEA